MHLPPVPRFLIRWTIRAVLVVLFIVLPAAIIYLREVGLGFGLKERIASALGGDSFRTEIGKLSIDPFSGLIAKNVEVWETGETRSLARIERVVVSVSFSDLLAGRVTIDHLQLDETHVSIPIGTDHDAPRLNVRGVSAELFIAADQVRISSLEGEVQGVKVVLSGSLQNVRAFQLQHPADQPHPQRQELLTRAIETLSTLKFPGAPPELRLKINGDAANLATLQVSPISLRSGPIITPKWRVDAVEAEADYEKEVLNVKRLRVRASEGELSLSAQWKNSILNFELSSTLGPESFSRLLPQDSPLEDLKFVAAPRLEATGRITHSASPMQYDVTGAIQLGEFSFRGMDFDSFATDFAASNGRIFLQEAKLLAAGGQISANLLLAPQDFRFRISNTIAPTAFAPLLGKKEKEALKLMDDRAGVRAAMTMLWAEDQAPAGGVSPSRPDSGPAPKDPSPVPSADPPPLTAGAASGAAGGGSSGGGSAALYALLITVAAFARGLWGRLQLVPVRWRSVTIVALNERPG